MKQFLRPFSSTLQLDICQLLAQEYALSTGEPLRKPAQNSVDRITDHARNDLNSVEEP